MNWETVIGMEVHVELSTESKMFCSCSASHFGQEPNTQVCPVCLGLPGALPVPNVEAIRAAQLIGLALGCKIANFSKFDRKNYFYPDLPKGYQISQYDLPFATNGLLKTKNEDEKSIRIRRVHLEEDTAKLLHRGDSTLIDFNRSGVPLVEIVTEPDLSSSAEVGEFLKKLVQIIRHLGVSSCDMEKGTLRLEANISLRKKGETELPKYKVEVKNVNSFRFIAAAIDFEVERQAGLLEDGKTPPQETRGFDEKRKITVEQRSKEEAKDYRYFPEPDIPPFRFSEEEVARLREEVPELPEQVIQRLKSLGLGEHYVLTLLAKPDLVRKFDQLVTLGEREGVTPERIANALVNRRIDVTLPPGEFIKTLSEKTGEVGIDSAVTVKLVGEVLNENPQAVSDYKKGRSQALGFLLGALIKKARTKIDPSLARRLLEEELSRR